MTAQELIRFINEQRNEIQDTEIKFKDGNGEYFDVELAEFSIDSVGDTCLTLK